ncbi:hypothetical protein BN2476_2270001 [Paraburkholderia piptadeniae]|uniref:Uncharacterized protein n=1 Tax=Paraburkholderia piptadeniae TaxID=1701573 RepID=A0A1N7SXL8_9BURK|nr:hypothetical protein BN2476_2270001 [Paraburkholderia piptadeniae]
MAPDAERIGNRAPALPLHTQLRAHDVRRYIVKTIEGHRDQRRRWSCCLSLRAAAELPVLLRYFR